MKKIITFAMTGILCLSMAACGNGTAAETNAQTNAETTTAGTTKAETTTAAETEPALSGNVVVYMPSPAGLADNLAAGFEEKTGVKVEQFQGTTGEILARLETESANPVADVVILASWADGLSMKAKDQLMSYKAENTDKINKDWVDADNTLYGTSASAIGVIYNTTIFPELSADWDELADAKYKDQLAIPDPEKSGSCKDFLSGYMYSKGDDGWKTWQALADDGMIVPGANKAALEAVTTGEKGILVAAVDYNAYSSMEKGEPLNIYYPKSGTVINPRPAMILKTSPNAENAKAFMDYLLSDDAQKLVADAYLLPGRADITCDNRSNVADIPTFKIDWDWMMANSSDIAAKLNEICK